MIPSAIVTIWDARFSTILATDVSADLASIQYSSDASGCAAAQFTTTLSMAQRFARGYWEGRNGVEISTADDRLQAPVQVGIGGALISAPSANWTIESSPLAVTSGTTYQLTFNLTSSTNNRLGAIYVFDGSSGAQLVGVELPANSGGLQSYSYPFTASSSSVTVAIVSNDATFTSGQALITEVVLRSGSTLVRALSNTTDTMTISSPNGTNIKVLLSNTKLYVSSTAPYDSNVTLAIAQIALYDGVVKTALVPVTGVGSDTGGPYVTISPVTLTAPGNPTYVGNFGAGALIYRRVWTGRVGRVTEYNQGADKRVVVAGVGIPARLGEIADDFTFTTYDCGQAIYEAIQSNASSFSDLNLASMTEVTVGAPYTGSNTGTFVADQIKQILAAIPSDIWTLRVSHDRVPRLVKLYTASSNTYSYLKTLSQHAVRFVPMDVEVQAEDTSQMANAQLVYGDTLPGASTPVSAAVFDSTSIADYLEIDAAPQTFTGVKDAATASTIATGLLNEKSYPQSSTSFKLFVRNDNALGGLTAAASPIGLADGDVVYGFEGLTVTGFDETNASPNFAPDSGALLGTGPDAIWQTNGLPTLDIGAASDGSNVWSLAANKGGLVVGPPFAVAAGQTFVFSAIINSVTTTDVGAVYVLRDAVSLTTIATLHAVPGQNVLASSKPFQIPVGTYSVQLAITLTANANASDNVLFAQPIVNAGSTVKPYVPNVAVPNHYGLPSSVTSQVDAGGDRVQQITFAPVEPDVNAAIAEMGNAVANALRMNTAAAARIDQYCVSTEARGYTYGSTSLVLAMPAFIALFAAKTALVPVQPANLTLTARATSYVWIMPAGGYVVKVNDSTPLPGGIRIGYFATNPTGIIGDFFQASIGVIKVGVGNFDVATNLPTPAIAGSTVTNGASLNGIAADVIARVALTNAPTNGSAYGVQFYVKTASQPASQYVPFAGSNLSGLPTPSASQIVYGTYGGLSKGASYDFGIGYVGFAGFGPVVDFATGYTALLIAIGAPYLLGGIAVTPSVSSPSATPSASANGVNAAVQVAFTVSNQPQDGSLVAVNLWIRQSGLGGSNTIGGSGFAWSPNGGSFTASVGSTSPPSTASYVISVADLTGGQAYDFGVSYENVQGGESTITPILLNYVANTIALPNSSNASMPAAFASNGPSFSSISIGTSSTSGTGTSSYPISFTVADFTASTIPVWFAGYHFAWRVTGTGTSNINDGGTLGFSTGISGTISIQVPSATTVDIGIAYVDAAGNSSTFVWHANVGRVTTQPINRAGATTYTAMPTAVTQTIGSTAGADGSYLNSGTVSSRHITNGAVLDPQLGTLAGSSFLNAQLSLNTYADAIPTLSSSTNSSNAATITVAPASSFNLRRTDGSVITILGSNQTLTGYSGSTTYYVYVWYSLTQNTSYTTAAVTNGFLMFAVFTSAQGGAFTQVMNKDGGVPILIAGKITTAAAPASGTSGGTGSGGNTPQCPAVWQEIETLERGFVRADALRVGDHLRDPEDGWNEIVMVEPARDTIVDVLAGDETFSVEIGHLWLRAGGDPDGASPDWIATKDLTLDTLVSGRVDGAEIAVPIRAIKSRGFDGYVRIVCDRNRFLMGAAVAHNIFTG